MKTKITASHVVAFDGRQHIYMPDADVVYENDAIIYVGPNFPGTADTCIAAPGRILIPGLISTHGHVTDAPFNKSFLEDVVSKNFFQSTLYEYLMIIWPTPDEALAGARASMLEMIRSGCTTFVDMTPDYPAYGVSGDATIPEMVAELAGELGVRAYIVPTYRSGIWSTADGNRVVYKWLPDDGRSGFEKNVSFLEKYQGSFDDRIRSLFGPAQVDTCSCELLQKTARTAAEFGVGITIHAAQSLVEFREIIRRYGVTPIEHLNNLGILNETTILAHAIFVSGHSRVNYPGSRDLDILADSGVSIAHSPRLFAKGILLESIAKYQRRGINISLAMDTVPLNMLEEMRLASLYCKIADQDCHAFDALAAFNAATLGSARALGRSDIGRIAPGAKADLVLVRADSLSMAPLRDVMKNLVYQSTAADVETVIIDGRTILKNNHLEAIDERQVSEQLQQATERMWQKMADLDWKKRTIDEISPLSLPSWQE